MTRKQELKAAFKLNPHGLRRMGVFSIRNTVNGKVYLDGSLNLEGTMERDRRWLELGGHLNGALRAEALQFGHEAFEFTILETLEVSDEPRDYRAEVALLLQLYREQLQPYGEKGYLSPPR